MAVKRCVLFGVALVHNIDFSLTVFLDDEDSKDLPELPTLPSMPTLPSDWPSMPTLPSMPTWPDLPEFPDIKKKILGEEEVVEEKEEKTKEEVEEKEKEAKKELNAKKVYSCVASYDINAGAIMKLIEEGADEAEKKAKLSDGIQKELKHMAGEAEKVGSNFDLKLTACAQLEVSLIDGSAEKFAFLCESLRGTPNMKVDGPNVGKSCPEVSVPCESPLAKKALEFGLEKGAKMSKTKVETMLTSTAFYRKKMGDTCNIMKGIEEELEKGAKGIEKGVKGEEGR